MIVTAESALSSVQASAGRLREAMQELVLIAVEDQPQSTELHLTTQVHDVALDLAAEAEQAHATLRPDEGGRPPSREADPRQVAEGQAHINAFGALLVRDLAATERLNDLATLGRDHGREAGAWAREIIRCIETCQFLLWTDVQPALLAYWQELADMTHRTRAPSDGR